MINDNKIAEEHDQWFPTGTPILDYINSFKELAEYNKDFKPPFMHKLIEEHGIEHMFMDHAPELGEMKQCYMNSWQLLSDDKFKDYVYMEGMAASFIPVSHAWVASPCLQLGVETTWKDFGYDYWGLPLKKDFVMRVMAHTECYGVLDNMWMVRDNNKLYDELVSGDAILKVE